MRTFAVRGAFELLKNMSWKKTWPARSSTLCAKFGIFVSSLLICKTSDERGRCSVTANVNSGQGRDLHRCGV